jgi:hypothetical protein
MRWAFTAQEMLEHSHAHTYMRTYYTEHEMDVHRKVDTRIYMHTHTCIHVQIMRWKFTAQEILEDEFNAYKEDNNKPFHENKHKLDAMAMQVSYMGSSL